VLSKYVLLMKKIIFASVLFVFVSGAVSAQIGYNTQPTPEQSANIESRAKEETDKLNSIVQLSSDQYSQVLQVHRNYFSQLSHSAGAGRPAARLGANREQQLKGILTSDQWQRLQAAKAQGQWQ
jgi:hypothetical protein